MSGAESSCIGYLGIPLSDMDDLNSEGLSELSPTSLLEVVPESVRPDRVFVRLLSEDLFSNMFQSEADNVRDDAWVGPMLDHGRGTGFGPGRDSSFSVKVALGGKKKRGARWRNT